MAKATTAYVLGATWIKIADAGDTLFIQAAADGGQILRAFGASQPAGAVGHVVNPNEVLAILAAREDLWLRALGSGTAYVTNDDLGSGSGPGATTVEMALTSAWVQAAASGNLYVEIDALDGAPVLWWVGAQPTAGSRGGNVLRPGDRWVDPANDASYWVRSSLTSSATTARIVVSKG